MSENILEVQDLEIRYVTDEETVRAVNDISFSLKEGESIGLVGETGAGKTTWASWAWSPIPPARWWAAASSLTDRIF